jgi:hypothetical protein
MKLDRPGRMPELTQLGGHTPRRGRGLLLLGICLLAAVIGGLAGWAGGARQEASPNTQVQRARLAAFVAGSTPQTITFDQPQDTTVGAPVTLSASAAPGLTVSFTSNTPAVCTVSGSAVTTMTAGVCVITAAQGGDATYAAAPEVARSFQVTTGQTPQTISFTLPPEVVATGVPVGQSVGLSASAAPGLQVSFASGTPAVCTVSGSTVLPVAGGMCTITATQGGSADYAPAPETTQSFQVTTGQTPQTISFTPPPEVAATGVPVGEPVALSASAAPGLQVSFTSDTPQVCTVSDDTVLTVGTGTCTITASQGGSANYAPAPHVQGSFEVYTGRKPQTITFDPVKDTPALTPVPLHATASSKLRPVTFAASPTDVCTVTESTVTGAKAGTCTITASQAGDDTWAPAQAQQTFQVSPTGKKSQTIAFAQPSPAAVGKSVTLSASASSGLVVSFTSGNTAVCTVSGSTVTTVDTGTCMITATQGGNADYAPATDVTRSFPVNPAGGDDASSAPAPDVQRSSQAPATPAAQTITFIPPPGTQVGEPVSLSASASSGLPVSFASNTPAVCAVSGSTVTTVAAGACMITASQGGSADWAPADPVTQSFPVNLAGRKVNPAGHKSQTITFDPPSQAKAGEPIPLSASASSGLPVSFASDTPPVCTVSGSTVRTMAAGACKITASQSGSADFAAAPPETRSFQVNPASSNWTGPLVFLLAAAVMTAAGLTSAVRHIRLRSRRPLVHVPHVRAVPEPGPPDQVDVHGTGPTATHTVRIESNPGASITTIEEARP